MPAETQENILQVLAHYTCQLCRGQDHSALQNVDTSRSYIGTPGSGALPRKPQQQTVLTDHTVAGYKADFAQWATPQSQSRTRQSVIHARNAPAANRSFGADLVSRRHHAQFSQKCIEQNHPLGGASPRSINAN